MWGLSHEEQKNSYIFHSWDMKLDHVIERTLSFQSKNIIIDVSSLTYPSHTAVKIRFDFVGKDAS